MSMKLRPGNLFSFWYSLDYNLSQCAPRKRGKGFDGALLYRISNDLLCEWLLISKTSRKISSTCTWLSSVTWDGNFGVKCGEGDGRRLAGTAGESVKEGAEMGSSRGRQARRHPLCN